MCKTCDGDRVIVLSTIVYKDGRKEPCVTMSCPECYKEKEKGDDGKWK